MSVHPKRCPRCWASRVQLPLQHGRTGSFDLFACQQCGGVWLDAEAAGTVMSDVQHVPSGQPPSLFCPCCDRGMAPLITRPSGVVVDLCDEHGVWFDAHELDAICAEVAKRKGVRIPARAAAVVGAGAVVTVAVAGAAAALAVADASPEQPGRGNTALEIATEMPETIFFGAQAAAGAVSDAVDGSEVTDAASGALEGAAGLAEGAAEAGTGVLEAITSVLGALFD